MIVLDASVVVKVYLEEIGSDEASAVLVSGRKLLAPDLIRVEVCGALCRRVRRGEIDGEEARRRCQHWLERLNRGLFTLTADRELMEDAVKIAIEIQHPIQDCLYLAAARRFDVPLITSDRTFRDRALPFDPRVAFLHGCENN
jgi:predicted nucleic acid-binding protein